MNAHARIACLIVCCVLAGCAPDAVPAHPGYSAAALYNLGNEHARGGRPGMAVLNYERAALLTPNDPDVAANLRLVRRAARLPNPPSSGFDRLGAAVGPTAAAWIGALGASILAASLLGARRRVPFSAVCGGALAGLLLAGVTVCNGVLVWPRLHAAVVIARSAPVRATPVPMADVLFALPEAELVVVTASRQDFLLIRTAADRAGWVARADVATIVPTAAE